jgi:hypothetical protein
VVYYTVKAKDVFGLDHDAQAKFKEAVTNGNRGNYG